MKALDWILPRHGYHYTTAKAFRKIRKEGLKPARPTEDKIQILAPLAAPDWNQKGIWVWRERLSPVEHAGSVLFAACTHGDPEVVVLRVQFDFADILRTSDGSEIGLRHVGKLGVWRYHRDTRAWLLTQPVPPEHIEMVTRFDIVTALRLEAH